MEVNANLAQDVFKDAGESVIFVMLSLKREDIEKEREIIADMADRMEAIQRSMNIRVAPETVKLSFGFSNRAWEYLFPTAKKPKELEDFQGGKRRTPHGTCDTCRSLSPCACGSGGNKLSRRRSDHELPSSCRGRGR